MSSFNKIGFFVFLMLLPSFCLASVADELQASKEKGQVAFMLVMENSVSGVDQAKSIIRGAMQQVENSVMIEMDRLDPANSDLVAKYRLSGAILPLIIVFAPNGVIAGGNISSKLNTQLLVDMVPSPKKCEVLKALEFGQAVLVIALRPGMDTKSAVLSCCASAGDKMSGKCQTIQVNMDDEAEVQFLKQLKVDLQSKEPVTVVINAQGQVTGSFNGPVDIGQLVSAATKKAGGCCPSGSGKSCAPAPKKGN